MKINVLKRETNDKTVSRDASPKLDEFVQQFREGQENEAIQAVYAKHHKLFYQTSQQYFGLDDHTIESSIWEQIWKGLLNYDESKSGCKLTTMICTYLKNDLRTLTQANSYNKRKINDATNCSYFSEFDKSEDRFDEASEEANYSLVEMRLYLDKKDLTPNQRKYCEYVTENIVEGKMASIASELGVSRAGALQMKKALQVKLSDLAAV